MDQKKLTPVILVIFAAIIILGTALQFVGITLDSLWYDESYTAAITGQSFGDIISISGGDSHPPLYYLMLKVFQLIFGNSVLALRTFSVLGVLALALLGIGPVRRALGIRVGMLFSVLVFIMPISVAMAHEARMYTWAAFFVTGSALYGYLAQKDGKRKDWAVFVIFSLAAAYTHYYALLAVVIICAVMLVYCFKEKAKRIPYLISAGILLTAYLPWVFKLAGQVSRVTGSYWIPPVTGKIALSVLAYPFGLKFPDANRLGLALPALLIALGFIVWGIIRQTRKKEEGAKMVALAFGTYLLTILAGILASVIIRPVLVERYMMPVLGVLVLALAYGLASLKRRLNFIIAVSVMAAICVPQIYTNLTTRVNGPMNEVKAALLSEVQPGDVFLHTDEHTFGTFSYYFPEQKHYYYQREGYEGFSNFDAFAPNGIMIDSLEEIEGSPRIWFAQRPASGDQYSAKHWISTGALLVKKTAGNFSLPTSWYSFSVMRVAKGDMNALNEQEASALSGSGSLNIKIDGLRNDTGRAVVLLYNREPMAQEPHMALSGGIEKGKSDVTFTELPYGEYAILAFHDENANNAFDMNGDVPAEGLGYSNITVPPGGPPDFQICKFLFSKKTQTQTITLHYFE